MRCGRTFLAIVLASSFAALAPASRALADEIRAIVDALAGSAVPAGLAPGVAVAVIRGDEPVRFFSYGLAVAGTTDAPFTSRSIFEIGSVTKVFTTNLFGQLVNEGALRPSLPLSRFEPQIGVTKPLTSEVTLGELGSFTGGFPSLARICRNGRKPAITGCLPNDRPPVSKYGAAEFAAYFRHAVPRNHQEPSHPPTSLPAPYFYSDYSLGLLGLLIGQYPRTTPLDDDALIRWENKLRKDLLEPLGMPDTALDVPESKRSRRALGYDGALGAVTVANGQVASIALASPGGGYADAPSVQIAGGGGQGATATAAVANGHVSEITVIDGGSGYVAPATVTLAEGGATTDAAARIVARNGRVTAVFIQSPGAGYQRQPTVQITGGRANGVGRDATAVAYIANGAVSHIEVVDPGAAYVEPLAVVIAPGAGMTNPVPIWAPAGALKSTLEDMARFAQAALGIRRTDFGDVPKRIREAFAFAEAPYACTGADPSRKTCPPGTPFAGQAWDVAPRDSVNRVPRIVSKNGGLNGFSTQVELMPDRRLGIVVFVNSRQPLERTGKPTGLAATIARNLLFALFYDR